MALMKHSFTALLLILCSGCSKDEPLETDFAEPRPAKPPLPETLEATFEVASESRIEFSAPARHGNPSGYFSRVEGEIWVDLANLKQARATLRVDLRSVHMTAGEDPESSAAQSREAQRWLGAYDRESPSLDERARWATFVLEAVDEPSARAAAEGKRAEPSSSEAASELGTEGEVREVHLTARGALTLNAVRVRYVAPLTARFHYPAPALSGALPDRLELSSRAPVRVSLLSHDIKPRNASGRVVATELRKLGNEVGREARIEANIEARRRDH